MFRIHTAALSSTVPLVADIPAIDFSRRCRGGILYGGKKKEISKSVVSLTSCANVDSVHILFLHEYLFSDVRIFMGAEMKREGMHEGIPVSNVKSKCR